MKTTGLFILIISMFILLATAVVQTLNDLASLRHQQVEVVVEE